MTTTDIDRALPFERMLFGTEAWSRGSYRTELADRRHRHYVVADVVADMDVDADADTDAASDTDAPSDTGSDSGSGAMVARAGTPVGTGGAALGGWAGVMVVGATAEILTVGVVPAWQRRGIGQTLLDALLAEAVRRGAGEVFLEVRVDNASARRLYERNGFAVTRIRRGYYDLGRVDAVEMHREL